MTLARTYASAGAFRKALEERLKSESRTTQMDINRLRRQVFAWPCSPPIEPRFPRIFFRICGKTVNFSPVILNTYIGSFEAAKMAGAA